MDWVTFELVKGVGVVPGDTLSVESPSDPLDLMNIEGFSIEQDGWIPNFPQVKDGGLYADSPIADGRQPVAFADDAVTEIIALKATGAGWQSRYILQRRLAKFAQDARDFHTGVIGGVPVYLKAKFPGAPLPQYALVNNIQIAQRQDPFVQANFNQLTITIERDPQWRSIPPSDNPKRHSYERLGQAWQSSNASLISASGHLVYGTCYNRQEFNTLYTFLTPNYIDVAANLIPGDAPCPVLITVQPDTTDLLHVFIAKSTKPVTITDRAGNAQLRYNILAAAGAAPSSGSYATDTTYGIVHTPQSATMRYITATFSGTSENTTLSWPVDSTHYPHLNQMLLRGQYAIFIRARESGISSAGSIRIRFSGKQFGATFFDSGQVVVGFSASTPALHYMGMLTLPNNPGGLVGEDGLGLQVETDLSFEVSSQRLAGSNALGIYDVIFMPIDEGMIQIIAGGTSTFTSPNYIYDSSGHLTHGRHEDCAIVRGTIGGVNFDRAEVQLNGGPLRLTPGVNNRLYFLVAKISTVSEPSLSDPRVALTVAINAVPQWYGPRSE